jgi:hypothetical protein
MIRDVSNNSSIIVFMALPPPFLDVSTLNCNTITTTSINTCGNDVIINSLNPRIPANHG